MRRQEVHLVGLRNDLRGLFGEKPVRPYGPRSRASRQDTEELQAFKHRVRENTDLDWDRDLTTTTT